MRLAQLQSRTLFALVLSAILLCAAPHAQSEELKPFSARYQVKYRGLSAGVLQLTLRKDAAPGQYIYESRAQPSFFGSFMISAAGREASTLLVDAAGVRPLKFVSDDGKKGDEKDSNVTFDWERKRLTGRSERTDFDQELPARIQDHLSIQVAVLHSLQGSGELGEFSLVDAGAIKQYTYRSEGPANITFQGRSLATTIVRSERNGSSRVNRYWHAAALNNVPVHAERLRDGKVDLTLDLLEVKFGE